MTSCIEGKTHIMWTVDHIKVMKDKTTAAFAFTKIGTYVQNPPQEVFFMSSPNLLNEEQPSSVRDKLPPSTSFFANSRTLMGCTDPLRRGVGAPHQCPLESVACHFMLTCGCTFR